MPKSACSLGKLVRVVVTTVLETVLLIGIAVALFHLPMPSTGQRWLTLGWDLGLGTVACALAAIAYTALIPNGRSAAAVVTPVFMALQFISGVFFPFNELPRWMQSTAALFPVKWMAQGFKVSLPAQLLRRGGACGPVGTQPDRARARGVGGGQGILAAMTFRWKSPKGQTP